MKVKLRRSNNNDLDDIYNLHVKCFEQSDQWYKSIISQYLHNGYVLEIINEGKIIGVLLQGDIIPCSNNEPSLFITDDKNIKEDFNYSNNYGKEFVDNNNHLKEQYGIVMICINPKYRGKGLAKNLIKTHIYENPNKLLCLNTRRSNINAYQLYKTMNYIQIAFIKNKYFLPNEDSIFMILNNEESLHP